MHTNDLKQPDAQIIAIAETMGIAEEVMNEHGCETLLVVTLGKSHFDALIGGQVDLDALDKIEHLIGELRNRVTEPGHESLHVWSTATD